MRPASLRHVPLVVLVVSMAFAGGGCSYVHFGRIDRRANADPKLAAENSDLRMEKKLLQEELAIARKEGAALRAVIDNQPAAASGEMVAKLNETTRELATLRANYARLQAERERLQSGKPAPAGAGDASSATLEALAQAADLKTKLGETEDKLAESLRTYTQLQEENTRLRTEVDTTRSENAALTTQVARITTLHDEARAALAQLNNEFLAQKQARAIAEQDAETLRTQVQAMAAMQAPASTPASLADARSSSATGAREIEAPVRLAQAPASSQMSMATLSTNPDKIRATAAAATPAPPGKPQMYTVRAGDTLEKIAEKFYGRRDRWSLLYAANNSQLSGGRPLKPGMELEIPEE